MGDDGTGGRGARRRRGLALWLAVVVGALLVRVIWGGAVECQRARAELDAERPYQAVLHYERAIRWYLPGSPFVATAADALWSMGEQAEADGDPELALFAYRGLRGAAYATRSFYQPLAGRIAAAEDRIAALMAADARATWPDRSLADGERVRVIRDNLREHTDPAIGWVIVLELGFVAWLGSGGALAWRIGRPGTRRRTTYTLAAIAAVGYLLWLLGLWQA